MRARTRAGFLLYAGIQFIVFTTVAMLVYAGGSYWHPEDPSYEFFGNFLSDLGATVTWGGHTNTPSSILFATSLITCGIALMLVANAWREFAFDRRRARGVGIASQVVGSLSGLGFCGVAAVPWNWSMHGHNACVLAAFSLLTVYIVTLIVLSIANGLPRGTIIANGIYVCALFAYMFVILLGPRMTTEDGQTIQVGAQKAIVYLSMLHLAFLGIAIRQRLRSGA